MILVPLAILFVAGQTPPAPATAPPPTEQTTAGSPAETVEAFLSFNKVSRLGTGPARALVSGELTGMTARTLGPLASPDKIVAAGPRLSVARLPATGENPADIYLYVAQSDAGAWTISAVRALALPPFLSTLRNDLIQRVTLTDKEAHTLAQINLAMQSDAEHRAWFAEHRTELGALRDLALAQPAPPGTARAIDGEAAQAALKPINASSLEVSDQGAVIITLGSIGDNSVGFLFADTPNKLPVMDGHDYIWIEAVGGGWHLFKST
jgi:hypothetical protein